MQRGGNRELVSGRCVSFFLISLYASTWTHSIDGIVCMWDIRMEAPIRITQAHAGGLMGMAVHDQAPVFATCVCSSSLG